MFTRRIFNTRYLKRCYCSVTPIEKPRLQPLDRESYKKHYISSRVRIYVRGGKGGQGSKRAGGIGGDGGSVYVKCSNGASLSTYALPHMRRIIGGPGGDCSKHKMNAKTGEDVTITIPPGTVIKSELKELLHDMNVDGEIVKLVSGGDGGSPFHGDKFQGQKGEFQNITFELKTIADVALTGFPNAGKSSLLRCVSRAAPKVGHYQFTTINPMVGSILYSDNTQVKVVDIPGLIEDAHLNKGMGHHFLRHIERTKLVLLVIDINGFQLTVSGDKPDSPHRSPLDTTILLMKELALYQDVILTRPFLLVINKMDTDDSIRKRDELLKGLGAMDVDHPLLTDFAVEKSVVESVVEKCKEFAEDPTKVFRISALYDENLDELKMSLYDYFVKNRAELKSQEELESQEELKIEEELIMEEGLMIEELKIGKIRTTEEELKKEDDERRKRSWKTNRKGKPKNRQKNA